MPMRPPPFSLCLVKPSGATRVLADDVV